MSQLRIYTYVLILSTPGHSHALVFFIHWLITWNVVRPHEGRVKFTFDTLVHVTMLFEISRTIKHCFTIVVQSYCLALMFLFQISTNIKFTDSTI